MSRTDPDSLRRRGSNDLADDFIRLDRRRLVAMPETDADGFQRNPNRVI